MKIVVDNCEFDYDTGCKLLKTKYGSKCPFEDLSDIWDSIKPLTFKDIAKFENIEQRRIGILCLGMERLLSEVQPELVDKKTMRKNTTWINSSGKLETIKFNDTYELYKVDGKKLSQGSKQSWQIIPDAYFVKCKCTSTDREYMIWVDINSVYDANNSEKRYVSFEEKLKKVNAIQAIAWTIQTNVPKDNIEKIIRQGDCILIKPKTLSKKGFVNTRHLTEKEYREFLVSES